MNIQGSIAVSALGLLITSTLMASTLLASEHSVAAAASPITPAERAQIIQRAPAPLLPRASFIKEQALQQALLAPDGRSLAYRVKQQRHEELWRYDIDAESHHRVISSKGINEMHWSADGRHLFYINRGALLMADMQAKNMATKRFDLSDVNVTFVRPDPDLAGAFWVRQYHPATQQHALVFVDHAGNETTRFTSNNPLSDFQTQDGEVVLVAVWIDDQIHVSGSMDGEFIELLQCRSLAPCRIHHWNPDTQTLLVSALFDEDVLSLYAIDTKTGERDRLHQDPARRFDIGEVALTDDGEPYLVLYRTSFVAHHGLNEKTRKTLGAINGKTQTPVQWLRASKNQKVWLVVNADPSRGDTDFLLYDAEEDTWQQPLAEFDTTRMDAAHIAPRIPFWFKASDGMELHGYVTLPLGKDPSEVPLVVHPHGGPWSRAEGNFNATAQFLANRGYAVFEPNFRSSTGLGYNYVTSANRDFGEGRVQQDILDGVDYLLSSDIGDPAQLAIAGHSFGGFSALTALAFTPKKFQVGYAGAAPVNLTDTMLHYQRGTTIAQGHSNFMRIKRLMIDVNDATDVSRLYEHSPDKHWERIERPLYLWAGGLDDRVAVEGIRDIALRLSSSDQKVALLSDPQEGHGPEHPLAKEGYFYLMEHALAKHIHGAADVSLTPSLQSYLNKRVVIDSTGDVLQ